MVVSFIVILIIINFVESLYVPEVHQIKQNGTAEEIQHAICKISSKDLEATANATIFRELRGVCTSVELQTYVNRLEYKIVQQINDIKYILQQNGFKIPSEITVTEKIVEAPISDMPPPKIFLDQPSATPQMPDIPTKLHLDKPVLLNTRDSAKLMPKSLENAVTRTQEINAYNDTIVDSNKGSIYMYYWKVPNIKELLLKKEMYISSPEFFALGHSLHLQFYPNYFDEESFAVQLRPSSKGFVKKHKIYIVNQRFKNADIDSGLLFGFKGDENMFRMTEDIVKESGYIYKNSLMVKLEILLNS